MLQPEAKFKTLIDFNLEIGESPVWDERRGVLWFVDILSPAVLCLEPTTRKISSHAIRRRLAASALVPTTVLSSLYARAFTSSIPPLAR